jgi:hypothetical protein
LEYCGGIEGMLTHFCQNSLWSDIRGRVFEEALARGRLQKLISVEKFSGARVTNAIAGPS